MNKCGVEKAWAQHPTNLDKLAKMFKFTKHSHSSSNTSISTIQSSASSSTITTTSPNTSSQPASHHHHPQQQVHHHHSHHPHHHHHHQHVHAYGGPYGSQQGHHSNNVAVLGSNQLGQFFEVGKLVSTAGPEHVWKVYDGWRKCDGKVSYFTSFIIHELRVRGVVCQRVKACSSELLNTRIIT